jgi:hypothetical protein
MNILIIGDSHAKCRLPNGYDSDIIADVLDVPMQYRLARSGSTAHQWLDRANGWLEKAIDIVKWEKVDAVFVSLGGNDMFRDYADGRLTTEEGLHIMQDIRSAISQIPHHKVIVLVYGDPYKGTNLLSVSAVVGIELAYKFVTYGMSNVTLLSQSKILTADDWCGTDIHPNESGYVKIAEAIKKEVEK